MFAFILLHILICSLGMLINTFKIKVNRHLFLTAFRISIFTVFHQGFYCSYNIECHKQTFYYCLFFINSQNRIVIIKYSCVHRSQRAETVDISTHSCTLAVQMQIFKCKKRYEKKYTKLCEHSKSRTQRYVVVKTRIVLKF